MQCVTSASYTMLFNDSYIGPIIPGRGLRQGNSLSPYLFILCVEGLSYLIRRDINSSVLHGVKIFRNAPIISHVFFSDYSFFFFRANIQEARAMKHIFSTNEATSSQSVNFA